MDRPQSVRTGYQPTTAVATACSRVVPGPGRFAPVDRCESHRVAGTQLSQATQIGAHHGGDHRVAAHRGVVVEQDDGPTVGRELDGAGDHPPRGDVESGDDQGWLAPEADPDPVTRRVHRPRRRDEPADGGSGKPVGADHDPDRARRSRR